MCVYPGHVNSGSILQSFHCMSLLARRRCRLLPNSRHECVAEVPDEGTATSREQSLSSQSSRPRLCQGANLNFILQHKQGHVHRAAPGCRPEGGVEISEAAFQHLDLCSERKVAGPLRRRHVGPHSAGLVLVSHQGEQPQFFDPLVSTAYIINTFCADAIRGRREEGTPQLPQVARFA